MKKAKGGCDLSAVYWGVRLRPKNEKKTYNRWRVLLSLVCALMLGAAVLPKISLADWKDRTCVFRNQVTFSGANSISNGNLVQYSWTLPPTQQKGWDVFPGIYYETASQIPWGYITPYPEYRYFDPTRPTAGMPNGQWVHFCLVMDGFMRFTSSFADSWNNQSYPILDFSLQDPSNLYPNGCSNLLSQEPDQTPNFDTGRPECNDQFRMN